MLHKIKDIKLCVSFCAQYIFKTSSIPAILIGTIDLYHAILLAMALVLPEGHEFSGN